MGWTDAVSSLPLDPGKVLTASLNNTHLWPAKRSQTSKMKHLPSQFPSVLVIYCFCMLQIPSSGKGTGHHICPTWVLQETAIFTLQGRSHKSWASFSTYSYIYPLVFRRGTCVQPGWGTQWDPQPFTQRLSPKILGWNSPCPRSVLSLWWWKLKGMVFMRTGVRPRLVVCFRDTETRTQGRKLGLQSLRLKASGQLKRAESNSTDERNYIRVGVGSQSSGEPEGKHLPVPRALSAVLTGRCPSSISERFVGSGKWGEGLRSSVMIRPPSPGSL